MSDDDQKQPEVILLGRVSADYPALIHILRQEILPKLVGAHKMRLSRHMTAHAILDHKADDEIVQRLGLIAQITAEFQVLGPELLKVAREHGVSAGVPRFKRPAANFQELVDESLRHLEAQR